MFRFLISFIFTIISSISIASSYSNDSVSSKDTAQINRQVRAVLKDFEKYLNYFSEPDFNNISEVDEYIQILVAGKKRIFIDASTSRVENDLVPGAEQDSTLASNLSIEEYLKTFATTYAKSSIPTVLIQSDSISQLYSGEGFLFLRSYNIVSYTGKDILGNNFKPMNRVFEFVCTRAQGKWEVLISRIRFAKQSDTSYRNLKTVNIIPSLESMSEVMEKILQDEALEKRIEETKFRTKADRIQLYIDEGDIKSAFDESYKLRFEFFERKEANEIYSKVYSLFLHEKEKIRKEKLRNDSLLTILDTIKYNFKFIYYEKMPQYFNQLSKLGESYDIVDRNILNSYKTYLSITNELNEYLKLNKQKEAINLLNEKRALYVNSDSSLQSYIEFKLAELSMDFSRESLKRNENAYLLLTNAIEKSKQKNQNAILLRAKCSILLNKFPKAKSDLSLYETNEPIYSYTYFNIAKALMLDSVNNGTRTMEAIEYCEKAIQLGSNDTSVFLFKSSLESSIKLFVRAVQTLTNALDKKLFCQSLYYYRGWNYYKLKLYNDAAKDFERLRSDFIISTPFKSSIERISNKHVLIGDSLFSSKNYNSAIEQYLISISFDNNSTAFFRVGLVNFKIYKDYDKAINYIKIAYPLINRMISVNQTLGLSYYFKSSYDSTIYYLKKELELNPSDFISCYYIGYAYYDLYDYNQSTYYFDKSLSINKSDTIYLGLARSYFKQRNYDLSLNYSLKGLKFNENNYWLNLLAGEIFFIKNNLSKAEKHLKLSSIIPNSADSSNKILIKIYRSNSDWEEFIQTGKKMHNVFCSNPEILDWYVFSTLVNPNKNFVEALNNEISNIKCSLSNDALCILSFNNRWLMDFYNIKTSKAYDCKETNVYGKLHQVMNLEKSDFESASSLFINLTADPVFSEVNLRKHPAFKSFKKIR